MLQKIFYLSLTILFISQVGVAQEFNTNQSRTKIRGTLIGPGDLIEAKVMGEDQFNFTARIDENGRFEVPFVNEVVMAKCHTEGEVREEVKRHLSRYLKNPLVSIQIKEQRKPIPVTVHGEVRAPSRVELRRREATLIELLSAANGVSEFAGGVVRVYRPFTPLCSESNKEANWEMVTSNNIKVPSKQYSLNSIQKGDSKSNPIIYPGDIIYVEKASPVYISGEVLRPQNLQIKEGGLSLSQALGMVGGPREKAKLKQVRVYRRVEPNSHERKLMTVDLVAVQQGEAKDMMLKPYDIIDFQKKKRNMGEILLDTLIKTGTGTISGIGYGLPNRVLY